MSVERLPVMDAAMAAPSPAENAEWAEVFLRRSDVVRMMAVQSIGESVEGVESFELCDGVWHITTKESYDSSDVLIAVCRAIRKEYGSQYAQSLRVHVS